MLQTLLLSFCHLECYLEPRMLPIWNKLDIAHDHCRVIISYHSANLYMMCSTMSDYYTVNLAFTVQEVSV